MTNLFFIATGGAIGAVARYLISIFYKYYFPNFPIGTLFVNFVGSVLIGILAGQIDNYVKYLPFVKYHVIHDLLSSNFPCNNWQCEILYFILQLNACLIDWNALTSTGKILDYSSINKLTKSS